jgi:hypothetical protein
MRQDPSRRSSQAKADRRDFLKVTAGAYTAAVLGTRVEAAQVPRRPDDLTGLSLRDASDLLDARKVRPSN